MTAPRAHLVVLAAGGTGGHVFPAEALAAELAGRGVRLALVTDRRGSSLGGGLGAVETHRIRAGAVAGKSIVARLRSTPELAWGTMQARALLKRLAPDAVIGFGGYASVLGALAGAAVITLVRALLSLQVFLPDGRSFVMPQNWVNVSIGFILISAVVADIWLRQERLVLRIKNRLARGQSP